MNPERFRNSPTGRLLQVGQGDATYWAFIPNPLPPPLPLDPVLVRALSDADRALGELSGLGRTIPNPHLLIAPFIRREAVLSSKIEGTASFLAVPAPLVRCILSRAAPTYPGLLGVCGFAPSSTMPPFPAEDDDPSPLLRRLASLRSHLPLSHCFPSLREVPLFLNHKSCFQI